MSGLFAVRATACVRASVIVCVVREGKEGRREGRRIWFPERTHGGASPCPAWQGGVDGTKLLGEIRFFLAYIRILTAYELVWILLLY